MKVLTVNFIILFFDHAYFYSVLENVCSNEWVLLTVREWWMRCQWKNTNFLIRFSSKFLPVTYIYKSFWFIVNCVDNKVRTSRSYWYLSNSVWGFWVSPKGRSMQLHYVSQCSILIMLWLNLNLKCNFWFNNVRNIQKIN